MGEGPLLASSEYYRLLRIRCYILVHQTEKKTVKFNQLSIFHVTLSATLTGIRNNMHSFFTDLVSEVKSLILYPEVNWLLNGFHHKTINCRTYPRPVAIDMYKKTRSDFIAENCNLVSRYWRMLSLLSRTTRNAIIIYVSQHHHDDEWLYCGTTGNHHDIE